MRRILIAVLAALTLAGLAAPAMAGTHHIRPQLVAPGTRHASPGCGFLDDGAGAGSALSLKPGAPIQGGQQFYQEVSGAWQMCWAQTSPTELVLKASISGGGVECATSVSNDVKLYACTPGNDHWWDVQDNSGTLVFTNLASGTKLCSTDGVGSKDVTSNSCTSYHSQWALEGAAKSKVSTTAYVTHNLLNCGFTSPAFDYNTNAAGNNPPAWGADWWPQGANTCGDWTDAHAVFSNGQNAYGPHETNIDAVSKATGPLSNNIYLTREYIQIGHAGTSHRCVARVYRTVGPFHCT